MGTERLLLGIIGVLGVFGIFFLLLGGFGTPWVGGTSRVFRKYLTLRPSSSRTSVECRFDLYDFLESVLNAG